MRTGGCRSERSVRRELRYPRPMDTLRGWALAGALALCACSVTTVEPQGLPEPSAQAMPAGPLPAATERAPVVVAAEPVAAPRPTVCERVLEGMRCEPGGPVVGSPGVELSPFYIDERPVSAGEYAACHAARACTKRPAQKDTSPDAAAVVDWQRAREVCAWLGKRLPSEWEWQGSARELAAGYEWTASAASEGCGEACTGRDPQGPCDGASPCAGGRVLRSREERVVEAPHSTRRSPAVRCASSSERLTNYPPRQLVEPYAAPAAPQPLSEAARRTAANIDQDPLAEKKICDETVRAGWAPHQQRGGRAEIGCRDPFPYIKANEGRTHVYAPFIANVGGGYVGVASDQNYSLIAAARSEVAWLMDYDPRVVAQHKRLRALILRSETPAAFIARFAPEAQRESLALLDELYGGEADLGQIKAGYRATREDLALYYAAQLSAAPRDAGDFGWLRNAEHYRYIRTLYEQGRIVPVGGDLMGERTLRSIAAAARALELPIRVVYLSNAPSAWGGQIVPGFRDNLRGLPFDARSMVLQTSNAGGFRQSGYWHYNVADGLHVQRMLARPGYDMVHKLLAERIPTPDGDVTVLALPGAGG